MIAGAVLMAVVFLAGWRGFTYAYVPDQQKVISRTRRIPYEYDLGECPSSEAQVQQHNLTRAEGLVKLTPELTQLGRDAFYGETFGNERFLTDVLGILEGPLRADEIAKALIALNGRGTTDLVVSRAFDALIGGRQFRKGEPLHTGIDVPRGSWSPLGMPMSVKRGRLRAGITCAACHSTIDAETVKVIEGASNQDLNAGLLLALATNSAAYFIMHTDVHPKAIRMSSESVKGATGEVHVLADMRKLEEAVDEALLQWRPGSFDSMTDMVQATTRIPVSWTLGDHPYSWSGPFVVGPFQGLSAQNNNVHALNSDSLILADASPVLFNMDKEEYIATLLRNAADPRYRYDARSGRKPSEFFRSVDQSPETPGLNDLVLPPTFPKSTPLGPDGTFTSSPGQPFWQQVNAMSAWQHTLKPPLLD